MAGPKDSKPQIKRRPWKPDDLAAIFAVPLFTGCATYSDWRHPGQVLIANHRFWVPLLGMVTGGRLEEIGQLLVSDVRKDEGVLFIDHLSRLKRDMILKKLAKARKAA